MEVLQFETDFPACRTGRDSAHSDSHPEWQPNFFGAQCENDRMIHQRCHFDG